eukprot:TRINITY_DN72416_c0_g1_i1.p1 TRINITY_DN72416_c0_g1~~TRINITY_DN72416_c0_g1_i1.p1  ORF type:complete len:368 (+),score=83.14 TRINITY_DN72416_c0_g1_i1:101-1204(+)
MAFMRQPAYGGPQTWADVCGGAEPTMDGAMLAAPWGDAIRAAVAFENEGSWQNDAQYAEQGPCGCVIAFMGEKGHGGFMEAAEATESAAKGGDLAMRGNAGAPAPGAREEAAPAQVDMNLPPHLACLARQPGVEVKEKADFIEALTAIIGQEVEMPNKYKVFAETGEELFFAAEQTNCIVRQFKQCCPDCAPWDLDVLYIEGGANEKVYKLERGWSATCLCFNRPVVNVIDVKSDKKIGSMQDPFACCDLTFNLRDANDNNVLKANGGCCQPGLICPLPCGPCAEVNFPIKDMNDQDVGHIQKKVPGCCKFLLAPDVQNYKVQFGGVTDPQYKVLLIALTIFIDFRYFSENSNDDNGGMMGAMGGTE